MEEEATLGPWMLPQNLEELHDAIIEFAIAAQMRADKRGDLSLTDKWSFAVNDELSIRPLF